METRSRGLGAWLAVALVALVACSGDGDDPAVGAASTATTTTAAPAPVDLPIVACCAGQPLLSGAYAVPARLAPLVTIEVPGGWSVLNEPAARLLAFVQGDNGLGNPSRLVTLLRAEPADADGLLDALATSPELELLGREANEIDLLARPNPGFEGSPGADIPPGTQRIGVLDALLTGGFVFTTSTPEARLRVLLRTEGDLLLVAVVEAPPSEFDAFVVEADELLAGLR